MEKLNESIVFGYTRKTYKAELGLKELFYTLKEAAARIDTVSFTEQASYADGGGISGSFPFEDVCYNLDSYLRSTGSDIDNSISFAGVLNDIEFTIMIYQNQGNDLILLSKDTSLELDDILFPHH